MKPRKQPANDKPVLAGEDFSSWELEGAHSGALLDFRRLMRGRAGFSLLFMQYNDPLYRDKLIPYLSRYAEAPEIVRLDPKMEYSELEKQLFDLSAGHDLIHVTGLSEWLAGEARSVKFRGFNYHRELLAERVRATLALWMTEHDIRDFALEAPDMWAWRKGVIDFSVVRQERSEVELSRLDLRSADFIERQRRMEEIESYLAEHPEESVSRANLLRELGEVQQDLGRIDDALQAFTAADVVYRRYEYKREHMFVLGDIARIYCDKGDVDEALKLHRERLEFFEQLGDKRSRAMTLGDIARIYVDKGDVDEALKLHREILEVFEQLGDKRSRAVTLGDIARIYVNKGDVEALKLHRERLEVFEQLGDVVGIAHTLWSMAQIDMMKKDQEKAFQHLTRSYDILLKLGRLDGICFVGLDYGRLLCSMGKSEKGVEVLRRSEEGFRKLGREDLADRASEIIARATA